MGVFKIYDLIEMPYDDLFYFVQGFNLMRTISSPTGLMAYTDFKNK